jgi:hypothetical protein
VPEEDRSRRWPAGCLGIDPAEPKHGRIEAVDEDIGDANWIVLADPVFHAFSKSRGKHIARITSSAAFSHSQSHKRKVPP